MTLGGGSALPHLSTKTGQIQVQIHFHNRARIRSALGFMGPMEFEEKMAEEKDTENAAIAA